MKTQKRLVVLLLAVSMVIGMLSGCGKKDKTDATEAVATDKETKATEAEKVKEIYYLNFKPEIAEVYDKIAADYEAETGVKVKVVTAASGTYEDTLKSEIAKSDPPTIFQINGPVGYNSWKDYCADLKDTKLYSYLTDPTLAVTSGDGVYGIPYVVEGYGIIYNNAIMNKYFALTDRKTTVKTMDEINNFATLKAVVEDMQARKADLGINGVFASTSLAKGEAWRWETHLSNVPFFYEFKENAAGGDPVAAGLEANEIGFKYAKNYQNIFDLYLNNSCTEKGLLASKVVNDSMAEFALGQVAMVQNGNWAWSQIAGVEGNTVKEEDIKFMPIYTGVEGEESQGLCIGTENYFAINSQVSEAKQQASIAFIEWLFNSEKGKAYVKNDLKFIAPFNTFSDAEKPTDPLAKEVLRWMDKDSVKWTFPAYPSQAFKDTFADGLLEYAQGTKTWDDVTKLVIDTWKSEKAATAQ